ncbi:hypothetical protein [Pseudobacillus badius]|uniref:hypothetical protein n=1 Tax=Bacillus badius TaxID=1455 RepID=UPI000A625C9A|nr:hypothetical protein [Bacillus badius]
MNGVLSASRLMTAAEVRKQCKEWRDNPILLLAIEFEGKQKLFQLNKKAVS